MFSLICTKNIFKFLTRFALLAFIAFSVVSCSTRVRSTYSGDAEGVYHIVQRGQTLYRIALTYKVDLDLIVKINRIADPSIIEVGQAVFIPGAISKLHVEPYYTYVGTAPVLPLNGTITSKFGEPRSGYRHTGIDIAASRGTPIRAALSGVVSFSGRQSRYGNIVIIEHAGGYTTFYAHNLKNLVAGNQRVEKGQHIALVGQSGNATGYHVHFELHKDGKPVNPIDFLSKSR